MADSNGNGFAEFCYQHEGITRCKDIPAAQTRLKSIQDSLGVKSRIEYRTSLNPDIYSMDKSLTEQLVINPQKMLVASLIVDNGLSSNLHQSQKNRFNYHYKNLIFKPNIGIIGFAEIKQTDITKNKLTLNQYNTNYPYYGLSKKQEHFYNGILKNQITYQYKKQQDFNFFHVVPTQSIAKQHQGNIINIKQTDYSGYDNFGYASKVVERQYQHNNPADAFISKKEIRYHHAVGSPYILGLKTQIKTSYGDNEEKQIIINNRFNRKGLLEEETLIADGKDIKRTNYENYNSMGKAGKISSTDFITKQTRATQYHYDQDTGLLISSENALGHTKQLSYQSTQSQICQKPTQITDANGRITRFAYDELCRIKRTVEADGSIKTNQWQWDNSMVRGYKTNQNATLDISASSLYKEVQTHYAPNQSQHFHKQITTYKDKLGRTLRQVIAGDVTQGQCNVAGGIYHNASLFRDYTYDRFGNKAGETRPYYSCISGTPYNNQVWQVSQYDIQNRLLRYTTHHNNQAVVTSYQYQDNKVSKYYQGQEEKTTVYNVLNKPVSISSSQGTVQFSYDLMGNLIQVNRNGLSTRMTYDSLGNKLSINDPDRGLWHYKYNGFGELIRQQDANGTVLNMSYDKLGRMLNKSAGAKQWQWQYDSKHAIGQISREISDQAQTQYQYDELGRITDTNLQIEGEQYHTQYHYNRLNQITKVSHPSGLDIIQQYDHLGRKSALYAPKAQIAGYESKEIKQAIEQALDLLIAAQKKLQVLVNNNAQKAKKIQQKVAIATQLAVNLNSQVKVETTTISNLVKQINYLQSKANANASLMNTAEQRKSNSTNSMLKITGNYGYKISLEGGTAYDTHTEAGKYALNASGVKGTHWYRRRVKNYWFFGWHYKHVDATASGLNPYHYYAVVASYYRNLYRSNISQRNTTSSQKTHHENLLSQIKIRYEASLASLRQKEQEHKDFSRKILPKVQQLQATNQSIQALNGVQQELNQTADNTGVALIWQATHYNADGALHSELFGNGYSSEREFDPQSNRLTRISTALGGKHTGKLIRDLHYRYDNRGNITHKEDTVKGSQNNYIYDPQTDHLIGWQYQQGNINITETYQYDLAGNLQPQGVQAQFDRNSHRLLSANIQHRAGRTTETYQYDNNGNMIQRGNTHISYDILSGKVQSINGNQQTFSYHVNGQLLKTQTREAGMQTQILHLNSTLNKVTKANGDELWRHALKINGQTVSIIEKVGKSKSTQKADRVAFIHRDLQGNSDRVTGLSGQEIRQYMRSNNQAIAALGAEQVIRNPYGRVVHANFVKKQTQGKAQTNSYRSVFAHKSVRDIKADDDEQVKALLLSNEFKLTYQDMIAFSLPGYTGHQEMPSLDLINMNARMYDPVLGRFISADSMVPDATNWDDYNRYMYVRGNPMRYTDPSGHSPKDKDSNSSECTGSSNDSDDCYDSGSSSSSRRDDDDDRSSDSRIKQTPPSSPVGGNEVQANKDQADKELKKKKKHYSQNGEPIKDQPVKVTKVAYVGGFFDSWFNGPAKIAYQRAQKNGVDAIYFTWDQGEELASWLDTNKASDKIVIGHSYGGDTAATVVSQGHTVQQLVTVDPVGWSRPNFSSVSKYSNQWINVNSVGNQSGGVRGSIANIIAGVGGAWNYRPGGYANSHINSKYDHATICDYYCQPYHWR